MKVNRRSGSLYHVKNDELILWRHRILQEAFLQANAHRWILPDDGTGLDEPVILSARFYLKKPLRPRFLYPAVKPDQDKLLRAVQDALAPRKGRRLLFDDSRVIGSRVQKDYAKSAGSGIERGRVWNARFIDSRAAVMTDFNVNDLDEEARKDS